MKRILLSAVFLSLAFTLTPALASAHYTPGQCVLSITKSVDLRAANPGDTLSYSIGVSNTGTADCTGGGVKIVDTVDQLLTFVSETHSGNIDAGYNGPVYMSGTRTLSWNAHTLAPGNSGTMTWTATVGDPSGFGTFDIPNTARVTADQYDHMTTFVDSNTVHTSVVKTPPPVNHAPIITGPVNASGTVGSAISFMVSIVDPDLDPLTITTDLPAGATYVSSTGIFSWVPASVGTSTATFAATDGQATTTHAVALTVSSTSTTVNHAPIITGPVNASGTVSSTMSFTVGITDPDNDPLVITTNLPAGATYVSSTGLFSWIPTSVGTSTANFTATDGESSTTHAVALTVSSSTTTSTPVNHPPVITGPVNVSGTVSSTMTFTVGITDPDLDPLVITTNLPAGATYVSSTGEFSWVPAAVGTSTASFAATDGQATTTHVVDLTVTATSTATTTPTSTPPTGGGGGGPTGGGGSGFYVPPTSTVPVATTTLTSTPTGGGGGGGGTVAGTSTANLPPHFVNFNPNLDASPCSLYTSDAPAVDPEGTPLTYSLVEAPYGMSISQKFGTVFWQPTSGQVSNLPYRVTIRISDGVNTVDVSYQVLVTRAGCAAPAGGPVKPTPTVEGESTSTVQCPVASCTAPVAEGPGALKSLYLAALGLATGIGDALGSAWAWLLANYCILGLILWLLTLAAFIVYIIRTEREKRRLREAAGLPANAGIARPQTAAADMTAAAAAVTDEPVLSLDDLVLDEDLGDAALSLPGDPDIAPRY